MKYCIIIILGIFSLSCNTSRNITPVRVDTERLDVGSSGMAQVDSNSFLAVYDLKNFEKGYRMGIIKTYADSIKVFPIKVKDWKSSEGIPSDLESVTRIPDRDQEYLVCESGNWQGKLGRIFHIKYNLELRSAKVLGIIKLPFINRNDFDLVGDQIEGIACVSSQGSKIKVILAERGGSDIYPSGILRWGEIDLAKHTIAFTKAGKQGAFINAPGTWNETTRKRDLTDLYIDDTGALWATASQDLRDSGPFYSIIYLLGKVVKDQEMPFKLLPEFEIYKAFPGYKIEALSGPSSSAPESRFSFGTEDEIYGGTWRPVE